MTEQNPGSWPDPQRPGYPQNPERDGWHFLWDHEDAHGYPFKWEAEFGAWVGQDIIERGTWTYLGPCLLPAEVEAREAAARQEGFVVGGEEALLHALHPEFGSIYDADGEATAAHKAGRREGIEAAAREVDCGCAARPDVLARLAESDHKRASYLCSYGDACCALQAAAIRALLEDGR